jgi:hypothetical protein
VQLRGLQYEACFASAIEDGGSGARPFQRLMWGRPISKCGGPSSLRREALAQQYRFQA